MSTFVSLNRSLTADSSILVALLLSFFLSQTAAAQLVFIDDLGNAVTAPATLDGVNEAVYFTDTASGTGGVYNVTNNATNYNLLSFGISNLGTSAWIGFVGNDFDCDGANGNFWCYEALNLDGFNWASQNIDFLGNTGFEIFGVIDNVLDGGDDSINFYQGADGDLTPGDSWNGFLYSNGAPQGQLFVVLDGPSGTIYGSGGVAVPEPGFTVLLVAGIGVLAGLGRPRGKAE